MEIFELKLLPKGYYTLYNDTVNPTVANAFGAAAFRWEKNIPNRLSFIHLYVLTYYITLQK